jgi:hypothetical protein
MPAENPERIRSFFADGRRWDRERTERLLGRRA